MSHKRKERFAHMGLDYANGIEKKGIRDEWFKKLVFSNDFFYFYFYSLISLTLSLKEEEGKQGGGGGVTIKTKMRKGHACLINGTRWG